MGYHADPDAGGRRGGESGGVRVGMSDMKERHIDAKAAAKIAKDYIKDLFSADQIRNIGLEEVSFDADKMAWNITVGFSRPWDETPTSHNPALESLRSLYPEVASRTYKVVSVSTEDGSVERVSNREI